MKLLMVHRLSFRQAANLIAATAIAAGALLQVAEGEAAASGARDPGVARPVIETRDVDLFYDLYQTTAGYPTVGQLQHDYIDKGTDGLRAFLRARGTTAERIADAIQKQPDLYAGARRCAAALPAARLRLAAVLVKLREVYPAAILPPVTVVIGRGKPVGIGSPATGLQIGLEALCGVTYTDANLEDRFVHVTAHEYVHVQQPPEIVDDPNPTVLEGSLMEGAAEFIGELTSGGVSYAYQAASVRGREKEIESAFAADIDKRDLSDWLYNSTMTKAGDLGYWVDYRIVKSYYRHARDKAAAVRDIIEMRDPHAFLAKSGWYPGIEM